MIDIHTHLLNGVDNGASDVIESLTSLKLAEEAGFTDVILTPHYIERYYENNYITTKPKIENLRQSMQKSNINLRIHQGNEIYISKRIGELIRNNVVSRLAGSRYILIEISDDIKSSDLSDIILEIKQEGCIPVLAHPERYAFVQRNVNSLLPLIKSGVLMQGNYGSIIGQYGKEARKALIKMLKGNMVHFLSTDTHKTGFVYGHFYKIEKEFLKYVSERKFMELTTTNAKHILEDSIIETEKPMARRKLFSVLA